MKIKIFCIGDIVGRPGRRVLAEHLHPFVVENEIDCVIANAENAAGGSGLTKQIHDKLAKYGVHLVTLGDHCYRKRDIISTLETQDNIVRPANLSPNAAGRDFAVYQTAKGVTVGVVTLIGRIFMKPADCPYAKIDDLLPKLKNAADVVIVEMHAEAILEPEGHGAAPGEAEHGDCLPPDRCSGQRRCYSRDLQQCQRDVAGHDDRQ